MHILLKRVHLLQLGFSFEHRTWKLSAGKSSNLGSGYPDIVRVTFWALQ